jgi:dihydroflavonol-4-reductase
LSTLDDLTNRLCLVTGGSGFVGSWVVDRLVAAGARVRCLVRTTSRRAFLPEATVELASGDVTDATSVGRAMEDVEYVFHVAGLIKAARTSAFELVNVEGTRNVVSAAAANTASVRRVLVVSSLAAVGPSRSGQPADENWEARPISPYGRSKLRAEEVARSFQDTVPLTIVRPPSVYGPRDRETLLVFYLARLPLRPAIGRNGAISVIHVGDLADGIIRAATHPAAVGATFFLTGDEAPAMSELLELIAVVSGRRGFSVPIPPTLVRAAGLLAGAAGDRLGAPLIFDRWKAEEIAIGQWACSNALARERIGFAPSISLRAGLTQTANWYQKVGWL